VGVCVVDTRMSGALVSSSVLSGTTVLSLVPCDCGVNGTFRKPDITSLLRKGEVVTKQLLSS
jgi:hypothetical protein